MRVFYQVWREPLMTLNGEHFISRALTICGAKNIFADLPIIAPQVSTESVLAANPDIIITGKIHNEEPDMSQWKKWKSLPAINDKKNNFIFVDSNKMHRHTARMILGIRDLCEAIDGFR